MCGIAILCIAMMCEGGICVKRQSFVRCTMSGDLTFFFSIRAFHVLFISHLVHTHCLDSHRTAVRENSQDARIDCECESVYGFTFLFLSSSLCVCACVSLLIPECLSVFCRGITHHRSDIIF